MKRGLQEQSAPRAGDHPQTHPRQAGDAGALLSFLHQPSCSYLHSPETFSSFDIFFFFSSDIFSWAFPGRKGSNLLKKNSNCLQMTACPYSRVTVKNPKRCECLVLGDLYTMGFSSLPLLVTLGKLTSLIAKIHQQRKARIQVL